MKDPHYTERTMNRLSLDLKIKMVPDVFEKFGAWWTADWRQVQLHLNPPDPVQICRIYEPFCTFTIAFQERAATGKLDDLAKWIRMYCCPLGIPANLFSVSRS